MCLLRSSLDEKGHRRRLFSFYIHFVMEDGSYFLDSSSVARKVKGPASRKSAVDAAMCVTKDARSVSFLALATEVRVELLGAKSVSSAGANLI